MTGKFEEDMQKLGQIRSQMEQEQTDLETMVQLYKEGLKLSRSLTEQLDLTEKEILTLEGLEGPNGELSDIQQAFIDEAAVQCGFCTPGAIMSAVEILNEGRELSDEEIRIRMSGHLCRCTGYENIFRAVKKTMLKRLGKE